jgi:acetyltransferase
MGKRVIAGVARCGRSETGVGEFAVVVADKWQRRGVGRRLMRLLASEAGGAGIDRLEGTVLTTNRGMLEFAERLGFHIAQSERGAMFKRVVQDLAAAMPERPEIGL